MSNSPRMGRGLDALWNNADATDTKNDSTSVAITCLIPNPKQPRRQFNEEALDELAASIKHQGIIQPILVRPKAHSKNFEIIAGERRWRAAKKAGLTEVPIFIKDMSDEEVMAAALIENIQREDLSPIEEALALQSLRQECGITQEELATRLGKSRSALANTLRLLQLAPHMQDSLTAKSIQAGHARTLLSLQHEPQAQEILHTAMIEQSLSVRDAEACVNYFKEHGYFPFEKSVEHDNNTEANTSLNEEKIEAPAKKSRVKSAYVKSLQERMKEHILVKTAISGNENRGRVTLTYTNAEELQQILTHLGMAQESAQDTE